MLQSAAACYIRGTLSAAAVAVYTDEGEGEWKKGDGYCAPC